MLRTAASVRYLATDASSAMVNATRARGIPAEVAVADASALPNSEASFDVIVAAWMLYHVPDLDLTLREVKRVLRPGGLLVAVTNGNAHLVTLVVEAGGRPLASLGEEEELSLPHFDGPRTDAGRVTVFTAVR